MKKGSSTSEFKILLLILVPWITQQFGVDLSALVTNPDDLAGIIKSAHAQGGNAPVWVALAYVVGRVAIKLRGGNGNSPN